MRMNTREVNAAKVARMEWEPKRMTKKEGLLHALKYAEQIDIDAEAYNLIKDDLGPDVIVTERADGKYYYITKEQE